MADQTKSNQENQLDIERIDSMMDFGKRSPHIAVAISQRKK
jgi:hypothetical protein